MCRALNQRWDLVVAEFTMRAFHGVTALSLVRAYDVDVPSIFVSGTAGEDVAAVQRADAAMYAAKRAHTGWAVFATDDAGGYGVELGNGVLPSTAKVRSLGEKGVA